MTEQEERYPRFSVLTSHDTAVWIQGFMTRHECSGTEMLRWLVNLAEAIEEIEDNPSTKLASIEERKTSGWGWGNAQTINVLALNWPDRKIVPAAVEEAGTPHPSGLRVIEGGKR